MTTKFNKVLIIDDNKEILIALRIFLRKYFHEIVTINKPTLLHHNLSENTFDVIILDMNFKAGDNTGNEGLYWLTEILKIDQEALVICITAYGEIQLAVKALQAGAMDFIEKPWDEEKLIASILRLAKLKKSNEKLNRLNSFIWSVKFIHYPKYSSSN